MSQQKNKEIGLETTFGTRVAYANGTLADNLSVQNFLFLGFTFYYTVIGLNVAWYALAFIIYSIWDAIDDPLIGVLSDRTKTKWGRRKPWIYVSAIPLCILMVLIWIPPTLSDFVTFLYLTIILIVFDLVFTTYTVNFNGLWPEMFLTMEDRSSLGIWRNVFTILGVGFAFLLPEIIIGDVVAAEPISYVFNGIIAAIIVGVTIAIMLKFGAFERKEFSKDVEGAPGWKESYQITFKNKAFIIYCFIALAIFIVYGILPTVMPLYATYLLNSEDPGLILLVGLLVSAASTPLWMYLRKKLGVRKSYMISASFWALSLVLYILAFNEILGYIFIIPVGIGLGGSLYIYDQGIAELIDDDEVRSGISVRREGAYYGVVALFNRLSGAINLIVLSVVFAGAGWGDYELADPAQAPIILPIVQILWPVLILIIAVILLYFYPLTQERVAENERMKEELHDKKRKESLVS
ncbi:MAG: putative Glucuronide carrier protein [Promethearchaeota archaeon]|nr:MAG: putative Glucuronide carrier protein [Candidatus Lokiarchaeota archaeon]